MVLAGSKDDQVAKVINKLLGKFMVGFVEAQSESFFGGTIESGSADPMPWSCKTSKEILEKPWDHADDCGLPLPT